MADEAEDFDKIPLDDRLVHKSWKARVSAYKELETKFNANNTQQNYADSLRLILKDANLVALETGLNAILAFASFASHPQRFLISFIFKYNRTTKVLVPLIIEKCFASSRSNTKIKAIELLLMFVEINTPVDNDYIIAELILNLKHKNQKFVFMVASSLREIVVKFGVKVFDVKVLLKALPLIFEHKDSLVRQEGIQISIELYKYISAPPIMQSLKDLKPLQLKELQDELETVPLNIKYKPERLLRSEMKKIKVDDQIVEEAIVEEAEEAVEPEIVDGYQFVEAVNVLDKLPKGFYDALNSSKWKERKEVLENLLEIVKSPKLEDGKYGELVSALGKKVGDANLVVAVLATNCIEMLAIGLRENFSMYKNLVVKGLIERWKEKKTNVVEGVRNCLDMIGVINDGFVEDFILSIQHKNPQVRNEGLKWLTRSLTTIKKPPGKPESKNLFQTLIKSFDDGDKDVRANGTDCFATLLKCTGGDKSAGWALLEKIDQGKKERCKEVFDEVSVACVKGGSSLVVKKGVEGKENAGPNARSTSTSSSKSSNIQLNSSKPKLGKSKKTLGKKVATTSSYNNISNNASKSNQQSSSSESVSTGPNLNISLKFGDDQSISLLTEYMKRSSSDQMFGSEEGDILIFKGYEDLISTNWKERLLGMNHLLKKVDENPDEIESEVLFRGLLKKPGFKENNFQVSNAMIQVFTTSTKSTNFNCGSASLIIPGLTEKLGDIKLKKAASDCLTTISESITVGFVISQMIDPIKALKAPKLLESSLAWVMASLTEFGIRGVNIKGVVDLVKAVLGNSNVGVRNCGVGVLRVLKQFVGGDIRSFVADMNGSLLSIIDAEFAKVEGEEIPPPTRFSGMLVVAHKTKAGTVGNGGSNAVIVEQDDDDASDFFPRVDISPLITDTLIENLGSAKWKIRKEGLDEIISILESSNKRIKSALGNDLMPSLKARLVDSNRNLAVSTLDILSSIATAMGRPFEKHTKIVSPGIVSCLTDNKVTVRGSAIAALDSFFKMCGLNCLIPAIATGMLTDHSILRKDLLKWLTESIDESEESNLSSLDLKDLLTPTLSCLQDRNSDVRKYAQIVLNTLVTFVGYNVVRDKASDSFHGSQLQTLLPMIETARAAQKAVAKPSVAAAVSRPQSSIGKGRPTSTPVKSKKIIDEKRPASRIGKPSTATKVTPSRDSNPPPILTSDLKLKEARADKDKGMQKWVFDVPRKELTDFLQEQCEGNFSEDIVGKMFSRDHYKEKENLVALTALIDLLGSSSASEEQFGIGSEDIKERYVANTDLLLKYITIRFFDTNTSVLLKCLDLLELLFGLLDDVGYHLSEYEASSFLPFFVNKTGDNKETMRVKMRGILKQLCRVYPASKLFSYVMKGLESKNARTRIECLEELAVLIQRNGISVCNVPSKTFPVIALHIADRDAGVRNGAINAITQAYLLVGAQVFKYIGKIAEKDKSLLEEKFKRLPSVVEVKISPKVREKVVEREEEKEYETDHQAAEEPDDAAADISPAESPKREFRDEFTLDMDKFDFPKNNFSAQTSRNPSVTESFSTRVNRSNSFDNDNNMMDFMINQITDTDPDLSINALKNLEKTLSSNPENVGNCIGEIISAMTLQIRIAFTAADVSNQSISRLCKHLVNLMVQLFVKPEFALKISRETLLPCVQEVLTRILDPNLAVIENGAHLTKAVNVLMVRVLDNCSKNVVFSVLLEILETSCRSIRTLRMEDQITQQSKYIELVMKCLWKITKVLPQLIETKSITIENLLFDIHNFFVSSPPNELKRMASEAAFPQAGMPLRTIRTILHELFTTMGEELFYHLELIKDPQSSHAVIYLRALVDGKRKKENINAADSNPSSPSSRISMFQNNRLGGMATAVDKRNSQESLIIGNAVSENLNEETIREELDGIFEKIRDKIETKSGISELYSFQKAHPSAAAIIEEYVSGTGNHFQGYIHRGLQSLYDANQGTPEKIRRATSMLSPPKTRSSQFFGESTTTDSQSNPYKERLEKLQQKFRGDGHVDSSIGEGGSGLPISTVRLKHSSFDSRLANTQSLSQSTSKDSQSYEELKERLTMMKLNMSKK